MKIYQTPHFVVSGKKVICILDVEAVILINGHDDGMIEHYRFKTRGVASCADCDEFDETKGRRIAESKASHRAYEKIQLWLKDITEFLTSVLKDNLDPDSKRIEGLIKFEEEHIKNVEKA